MIQLFEIYSIHLIPCTKLTSISSSIRSTSISHSYALCHGSLLCLLICFTEV